MSEAKTVFLVEDDADVSEAISDSLTDAGYRVLTARNGAEALDLLRQTVDVPRLILLDLMMPVMDGEEFRRAQLADPLLAAIPVVVLSAHSGADKLGAAAALKKPIALGPLLQTVREVCSHSS